MDLHTKSSPYTNTFSEILWKERPKAQRSVCVTVFHTLESSITRASEAIHFQWKKRERSRVGDGPLSDASMRDLNRAGLKLNYSNPPRYRDASDQLMLTIASYPYGIVWQWLLIHSTTKTQYKSNNSAVVHSGKTCFRVTYRCLYRYPYIIQSSPTDKELRIIDLPSVTSKQVPPPLNIFPKLFFGLRIATT